MDITSALGAAQQFSGAASQALNLNPDTIASLLGLFKDPQHHRLLKITTPQKELKELLLQDIEGMEAICSPYRFELTLLARDASIELKSLLGQAVLIELQLANGSYRPIHGYITRFSHTGSDGGIALYTATVEPWLALLAQRTNARIFQEKTVQQVLVELFGEHDPYARFDFRLSAPLKTRSYMTQYNESDLAFAQRLLEREGLIYYFEHSADPQQHTLIITDDATRIPALPHQPSIRFHTANVNEIDDSITQWQAVRQLQVGRVTTQTFDYRQPSTVLPITLDTKTRQGDVPIFERFTYQGGYAYSAFDDGQALVQRQLEALEADSKKFFGVSNARAMQPGYSFELRQHYVHDRDAAADRQFRLLSVTHRATNNYLSRSDPYYENDFACIREKLAFRPLPTVHKPVINGPQTAIVVGPPGEVMHTDRLGRVRAQFHWDRYGTYSEKSSCWMRVAQPWASSGFGAITLPRIGDEVVVNFLDGDPDRPLITGSLYNQQQQTPWPLPSNQTQSGFMSRSFKGTSDNANILRFDDKLGHEQLYLHAERNLDTIVEVDETHAVGGNRNINVEGEHTEQVKKNYTTVITEGALEIIDQQQHIALHAKTAITLKLADDHFVTLAESGTITLQVGDSQLQMNKEGAITLKGKAISIGGDMNVDIVGGQVNINH